LLGVHTQAYIAARAILQDPKARESRGYVFRNSQGKRFDEWKTNDEAIAHADHGGEPAAGAAVPVMIICARNLGG
jgi:hypothetical protein